METVRKIPSYTSLLILLSVVLLVMAYIRWEEIVIHNPDGSYSIDDAISDKIKDRVDRIQNKAEFYALVATADGYYICPLCLPEATTNGRYFLYFEEIYKVGVSISPAERYSKAELTRWRLDYLVLDVGNYSKMLVQETIFMGNYPLFPENLRRPPHRRLVTPPGSGAKLR